MMQKTEAAEAAEDPGTETTKCFETDIYSYPQKLKDMKN